MINAVVIDDEKNGRDFLTALLKNHLDDVTVVATAASALEGIKAIQQHQPDLIFLDVQMPHGTGFDLLEAFPERNFEVIFTTAHQQYALKAIKEQAKDYLVKPIDPDDLETAIERVRLTNNGGKKGNQRIGIPISGGIKYTETSDIIRFEGDGSYTHIILNEEPKILISKNLKELERLVPEGVFFRSHNSHLINCDYVVEFNKADGGAILMSDGSSVPIARRKKDDFLLRMNDN
jgi:two-component system LytT family response regulator